MHMEAVVVLLVGLLPLSSETACVNASGCFGCGSSAIRCTGGEFTQFPRFSAADAELVEDLFLNANHLTAISASDLQYFTSLVELDISNNNITHIEEGSFSYTTLSTLSLAENPLHCDCQLRWLLDYLDSLPAEALVDDGTCGSPSQLTGSSLLTLTLSQLTCECLMECGSNRSCDLSSGMCMCNRGYTGENCSEECSLGTYGLNCSEFCSCEVGSCHHATGLCTCLPDYHGVNCSHDCTGAPDCGALGREACSLNTSENSCGECLMQSARDGITEWGNSPRIYTTSASSQHLTTSTQHPAPSLTQIYKNLPFSSTAIAHVATTPTTDESPSRGLTKTQIIIILEVLVALLTVGLLATLLLFAIFCWKHMSVSKGRQGNKVEQSPQSAGEKSQETCLN